MRINHTKFCDIQCSPRSDRIKWFMHSVALDRTALGEMHSNTPYQTYWMIMICTIICSSAEYTVKVKLLIDRYKYDIHNHRHMMYPKIETR